ncbi:uncharacterized protein LOC128549808 [Mercenaria mercenaria]|uniref:uncharacterized protein LOC128549808 n=1 Tax=Mercenaria mercenaria TaxID=6596 RepID=UPI00234F6D3F|nr:uncharacterized protein LOC128549808 [Mercenaria mercenaria]
MLHTGLGPYQDASFFLSAINIPPIDPKNLKRREEEIGLSIEQCAEEYCVSLQEDIRSLKNDNEIRVPFDGPWQRRGSGRDYNSLSGHATLLGGNISKCIVYGVLSLDCKADMLAVISAGKSFHLVLALRSYCDINNTELYVLKKTLNT